MTRIAVSLAFLLLSPLALAQEGPPADLLAHVKPGQRWVYATRTSIGGGFSLETTRHVLEVDAASGKVVYMTSICMRDPEGGARSSAPHGLLEWTWGEDPARHAGQGEVTTERRTFEVPGAALDVLALRGGAAPAVVETLVAVRGDRETFPGVVAGPDERLLRVEQGPVLPRPPTPAMLVAHVQVGQLWTFRERRPGRPEGLTIFTITAVDRDTGVVTYDERHEVAGADPELGPGLRWDPLDKVVTMVEEKGVTYETRRLEVPGLPLECQVETDRYPGPHELTVDTRWTAVRQGQQLFPGRVKLTYGGTVMLELVKVE